MKIRFKKRSIRALTIMEVLVVIAILCMLAMIFVALFIPMEPTPLSRATRINCVSNLKQVNLSLRIWEEDNHNKYPMVVSVTNGGGMELIERGDVAGCLRVMSNELSITKILICPADKEHIWATNFSTGFSNSNISYFFGVDAEESYPQMIMSGDDNLATNGVPLKSGVVELTPQFSWTASRHINVGNIGYADGSVAEVSNMGLQQAALLATNSETNILINRIAIP